MTKQINGGLRAKDRFIRKSLDRVCGQKLPDVEIWSLAFGRRYRPFLFFCVAMSYSFASKAMSYLLIVIRPAGVASELHLPEP